MKRMITWLGGGLLLITLTLATVLWIYTDRSVYSLGQSTQTVSYDRHYVMISSDHSELWQEIYEQTSRIADGENVYLEWIGDNAPVQYSTSDCLRIAAASGVDGIILHPDGSESLTELIDSADEQGIPVVMVLSDDSESRRVSYVGMNNVQMGEFYGEQIVESLKDGPNEVCVLMNHSTDNPDMNLLYSQLLQTVESTKKSTQDCHIYINQVNTSTSFDAEEDIRDLFVKRSGIPDILVCLDLVSTECASQALVDYNEVGNVSVIGYYASPNVMEAIEKGIVRATLGIDAAEIGRICISALNEYWNLGRVSSYFNVGFTAVTQQEVLLEKERKDTREEIETDEH